MDIVKLCGVGLLCALSALLIAQVKREYSALIRICGTIIVFGALALWMSDIFSEVSTLVFTDRLGDYATLMAKALGLSLITRICSDICRDMGEGAVGSGVELGGRLAILSLCLPLVGELMEYAKELMEL